MNQEYSLINFLQDNLTHSGLPGVPICNRIYLYFNNSSIYLPVLGKYRSTSMNLYIRKAVKSKISGICIITSGIHILTDYGGVQCNIEYTDF